MPVAGRGIEEMEIFHNLFVAFYKLYAMIVVCGTEFIVSETTEINGSPRGLFYSPPGDIVSSYRNWGYLFFGA